MLLPSEIFTQREKSELPESESHVYRTLIGSIPMRTARAMLRLPFHDDAEILVDTPRYGKGKALVGLRAIGRTELLLSGNDSQTCLLKKGTA